MSDPVPRATDPVPRATEREFTLACTCRGASLVLFALVRVAHFTQAIVHVPALWDERIVPLCDLDTPVASFLWDGSLPAGIVPRLADVSELVDTVVDRLRLGARELVVAMVLLEALLARQGPMLQVYSVRPLLVATCILARKLTHDREIATRVCVDAMSDYFTALEPLLGSRIELQLLEHLHWRIPNNPAVYERHALALLEEGTPSHILPPSVSDVRRVLRFDSFQ